MKPPVPLSALIDRLQPGEPLPFRVLDNLGRLLLAVGQRVQGARLVAALAERGACVEYAEAEAFCAARGLPAPGEVPPPPPKLSWFDAVEQQIWLLDELLRRLTAPGGAGADWPAQFDVFTDASIALVERHLDAALFMSVRPPERRFALYALTHAMSTALVVLLVARQLGWSAARERNAVRAALTMNASTLELQARMAEQADPPTKHQLEQIRAHPQQSVKLLRSAGVTDTDWLGAIEDHHERDGGTGYPRALAAVGEMAHVLRAADVYMAKLTPRAQRPSLSPQAAAGQLFKEEQGGSIAGALIRALGVYPPGDFVRMKNGETGIVVERASASSPLVVASLIGATGKPLIGSPRRDTRLPEYMIAGQALDRSALPRVLPEQVYGLLE
jgi:hypothetical protein